MPNTNMVVLKPSRSKPSAGDLFVCNMRGKRWVAGRVVHTDCRMMSDGPGHEPLLYFYRLEFNDPSQLAPPFKPDLLVPPIITDFEGWRLGYFQTIGNYPLLAEERLERHYFLRGLRARCHDPDAVYVDEYGEQGPRPRQGDYWDMVGLSGLALIDDILSEALGIAPAAEAGEDDDHPDPCGEDEVIIYVPDAAQDSIGLALDIESPLAEALLEAGAGELEGHGYDLERERWDIRFFGPDPERIGDVLLPVMKSLQLPPGSVMVVGGKQRKRVDM